MNETLTAYISAQTWKGFLSGDRRACARVITVVENHPELLPAVRDLLIPRQKGAVRLGITGPPGVGKSTLTSAFAQTARTHGHRVGIIAVDPSSPVTGGALLGDRIRMQDLSGDTDVFVRSLASRSGRGGVSPATPYVADVFDAFGMDLIIIETVGVGQAEMDVMECTDMVMVVLQPATGDAIQAMKAGILEIGDMFVINKSDLPGADTLLQSMRFVFELDFHRDPEDLPPILSVSAMHNTGIPEVYDAFRRLSDRGIQTGGFAAKRARRLEQEIRHHIQAYLWNRFTTVVTPESSIRDQAKLLADTRISPYDYIFELENQVQLIHTDKKPMCQEDKE